MERWCANWSATDPSLSTSSASLKYDWRKLLPASIVGRSFMELRRRSWPVVCFINSVSVGRIVCSDSHRFNLDCKAAPSALLHQPRGVTCRRLDPEPIIAPAIIGVMRVLCLLSARNLGDAVIHSQVLDTLAERCYADRYLIWTFPQGAHLFRATPNCKIFTSSFPMGATVKGFLRHGMPSFLNALHLLRKERPTQTLDLVGDFRERLACRLLGAPENISPDWAPGHPMRPHIRCWSLREAGQVPVSNRSPNVYAAYTEILRAITGDQSLELRRIPPRSAATLSIGMHPFASTECKLWPKKSWVALMARLHLRYPEARFILFGAPADREALSVLSAEAGIPAEVFTSTLLQFREKVAELSVLVGLDSFSVHLASSVGVPAVVLVGPNDPVVFAPPTGLLVTQPDVCPLHPCYGKPGCVGKGFEYACMRSIAVSDVEERVAEALAVTSTSGSRAAGLR